MTERQLIDITRAFPFTVDAVREVLAALPEDQRTAEQLQSHLRYIAGKGMRPGQYIEAMRDARRVRGGLTKQEIRSLAAASPFSFAAVQELHDYLPATLRTLRGIEERLEAIYAVGLSPWQYVRNCKRQEPSPLQQQKQKK